MRRPKQRKLPAWIARWAQRDRAFAALICLHPGVAERLGASLPSAQAAQTVGCPRSTLYDWDALYKGDPASLVNSLRRRKTAPAWTVRAPELRAAILKMRKRFTWGIEKICATLQEAGWKVSEISVGHVVRDLLASGKIKRISYAKVQKGKRKQQDHYGERGDGAKPTRAGELLKMDTMHVTTPGGEKQYFISAVDAHTRRIWSVVYTSPSAANAADLLRRIYEDIKPEQMQVDGGSEFHVCYEKVCKHFGLRLIVLPPNSPKLNGHIESFNATLVRELLNFKGTSNNIRVNRAKLKQFISDYHVLRPHKALELKTPNAWMKITA